MKEQSEFSVFFQTGSYLPLNPTKDEIKQFEDYLDKLPPVKKLKYDMAFIKISFFIDILLLLVSSFSLFLFNSLNFINFLGVFFIFCILPLPMQLELYFETKSKLKKL